MHWCVISAEQFNPSAVIRLHRIIIHGVKSDCWFAGNYAYSKCAPQFKNEIAHTTAKIQSTISA